MPNSRDRGRGIPHPHRGPSRCPNCTKVGLSNWSARAAAVLKRPVVTRDCRYCSYGETKNVDTGRVTNTNGEILINPIPVVRHTWVPPVILGTVDLPFPTSLPEFQKVRREGADRDGHAHDCNAYGFLVAHATTTIKLATGCDECTVCGGDAEDCDTDGVCPGARVRRLRARADQVVRP